MNLQTLYRLRLAETIAAGDTTPMMVFPIGEWHSSKYPDLPLTEELANELIANFEAGVLGTEPVVDSSGKHDTSAPAAGWVKRVYLASYEEGDVTGLALWADVKWTALGATMLSDEQYKYGSVEIGSVVLNDSGDQVDNVLRSLTLTNTPVLRLMPGVKNAAEKQRAIVTLSLAEFALSPAEMPDALKASEEDDGNPVGTHPASSDAGSQTAKGDEGQPVTLDEGHAAPKGVDPMKTVAQKLNLAEDADEATILAEVVKLEESRDSEKARADEAVEKLAEAAKAARDAEVEAKLSAALIEGGHLTPGQKDTWLALAEKSPESFDAMAEQAKHVKAIELGEIGEGSKPVDEPDDANVALSELAEKIASERKLDLGEAMNVALAERPDLAARLYNL